MANGKNTVDEEKKQESIRTSRGFIWAMVRENIQDVLIGLLVILGLRKSSQAKDASGQATLEKQTPPWVLSAFPNLTREDDNEYMLALDSASEAEKEAAKRFKENVAKENTYDDIKYVVDLVLARREFMERVHHPAPENKGSERLSFGKVTINDPALAFFKELLSEVGAGTPEEIYERQKKHAKARNLLPKKHWMKKYKLEVFLGIFMIPWGLYQFLIWLLS